MTATHSRLIIILFASALPILPLFVTGCGTIRDIGSERITIAGPASSHIRLVDSSGKLNSWPTREAENRLSAEFDTDGVLLFVMRDESKKADSAILSSTLDAWAMIANLWLFFPIGHTIDAATGSQYGFDRSVVWFQEERGSDTAVITIYDLTSDREVDRPYRIGDVGILLGLHLGLRPPFAQAPVLGNDAGLILGYRIVDPLMVLYHRGWAGLLEYGEVPDVRMEIQRSSHSIDLRYSLPFLASTNRSTGFYALAGVGVAWFEEEFLWSARTHDSIPRSAIDVTMPIAGFGGGYASQGVYLEVRQEYGLRTIPIRTSTGEVVNAGVENIVIRWGVNVEF